MFLSFITFPWSQGDGNVAMPGPPAGAVVEDVLGLEDAVLMIAPWQCQRCTMGQVKKQDYETNG